MAKNMSSGDMRFAENRLESFKAARVPGSKPRSKKGIIEWPHKTPTSESLCKAGFFFRPGQDSNDNVVCFECNCALDGWEIDDDPATEHLANSRNCTWARLVGKEWETEENHSPHSSAALELRKETFSNIWPHDKKRGWNPTSRKMSDAGFYYNPDRPGEDSVSCTYCDLTLDGWEPKDSPIAEHKKRSPDCLFFVEADEKGIIYSPAKKTVVSRRKLRSSEVESPIAKRISSRLTQKNSALGRINQDIESQSIIEQTETDGTQQEIRSYGNNIIENEEDGEEDGDNVDEEDEEEEEEEEEDDDEKEKEYYEDEYIPEKEKNVRSIVNKRTRTAELQKKKDPESLSNSDSPKKIRLSLLEEGSDIFSMGKGLFSGTIPSLGAPKSKIGLQKVARSVTDSPSKAYPNNNSITTKNSFLSSNNNEEITIWKDHDGINNGMDLKSENENENENVFQKNTNRVNTFPDKNWKPEHTNPERKNHFYQMEDDSLIVVNENLNSREEDNCEIQSAETGNVFKLSYDNHLDNVLDGTRNEGSIRRGQLNEKKNPSNNRIIPGKASLVLEVESHEGDYQNDTKEIVVDRNKYKSKEKKGPSIMVESGSEYEQSEVLDSIQELSIVKDDSPSTTRNSNIRKKITQIPNHIEGNGVNNLDYQNEFNDKMNFESIEEIASNADKENETNEYEDNERGEEEEEEEEYIQEQVLDRMEIRQEEEELNTEKMSEEELESKKGQGEEREGLNKQDHAENPKEGTNTHLRNNRGDFKAGASLEEIKKPQASKPSPIRVLKKTIASEMPLLNVIEGTQLDREQAQDHTGESALHAVTPQKKYSKKPSINEGANLINKDMNFDNANEADIYNSILQVYGGKAIPEEHMEMTLREWYKFNAQRYERQLLECGLQNIREVEEKTRKAIHQLQKHRKQD